MDGFTPKGAHPSYLSLVERLPISGASIAVFDTSGSQSTVWASDPTAARLEELQFDLGQGPHWRALSSGTPVLVNDILEDAAEDWPLFGAAVGQLDVGALYSFPMLLGAVTIGVVDLYCHRPQTLTQSDYVLAIALCGQVAKHAILDAVAEAAKESIGAFDSAPAMRREVHQATGILLVHLDLSATEAFFVLRAHAFSVERTLLAVARDVVSGALDFRELAD
jgi:GAF domain-containing protein